GLTNDILYTAAQGVRVSFPAWKGDATKIAFVETEFLDDQNVWRINILDLALETTVITVLDGPAYLFTEIWDLDWSRAGDCLAFSAGSASGKRRSSRHVYTLCDVSAVQGGSPGPVLTQIIEGGSGVAWSPDDLSLVVNSGGELVEVSLRDYSTETLRKGGFYLDWQRSQ
ncbi:MAG: hypothetical protein IID05_07010, partial [Gemmatimonadetes bacterium]|nr:hypothetical protein [Gemmatimonadota bacterium]